MVLPEQPVFAAIHDLGAEPILLEEWVRELADDVFSQETAEAASTRRTPFILPVDVVSARIAPVNRSAQIVVPKALWHLVLQINHEPVSSAHDGGNTCTTP